MQCNGENKDSHIWSTIHKGNAIHKGGPYPISQAHMPQNVIP